MAHQIHQATFSHARHTDLALQTMGDVSPTLAHIQIFQPHWKIQYLLSQFHKSQCGPFPSIPCHLLRVPSSTDMCITAASMLSSSKTLGCRMDWDHPWTNHHSVPISSAFHYSGLISVIWFLFIHIACSHTHSRHTFNKVTKNVKCFYNPTKPHLLLQPPA